MFVGGYFIWTLIPHSNDHRQDYTIAYSLYQYTIDITFVQISNLNIEEKNIQRYIMLLKVTKLHDNFII